MIDALGGAQRVLVLGGSSELAAATLRALALRPGAAVVLAGRSVAALDLGPAVKVSTLDWDAAGGASAADEVIAAAAGILGDLDIVLAAAGVLGDQASAEASTAVAVDVLSINLIGVGAACLAAGRALKAQGHGVLVVFSSVAGLRARSDNFVYGASKAGLDALASGLADSLVGSGARVLVVRPGFVHGRMTTGMKPAPFATTPEAVGAAVAGAIASGAAVVHVPKQLGLLFRVLQQVPRPIWRKLSAR